MRFYNLYNNKIFFFIVSFFKLYIPHQLILEFDLSLSCSLSRSVSVFNRSVTCFTAFLKRSQTGVVYSHVMQCAGVIFLNQSNLTAVPARQRAVSRMTRICQNLRYCPPHTQETKSKGEKMESREIAKLETNSMPVKNSSYESRD